MNIIKFYKMLQLDNKLEKEENFWGRIKKVRFTNRYIKNTEFTLDDIRKREKHEEILDDVMYDVVERFSICAGYEY